MAEEYDSDSDSDSKFKPNKVDLIFEYVVHKMYPKGMSKNDKSNLRKVAKNYYTRGGQLFYRHKVKRHGGEYREVLVIRDRAEQRRIIKCIHTGTSGGSGDEDEDEYSLADYTGCHLRSDKTRLKILEKFYWKNVGRDVKEFVRDCDHCRRGNRFQVIPLPSTEVMKQIGVDIITNLPMTEDGYCNIIFAMDYFSKWPEARALKDLSAESIAKFLFEDIFCRHGSVKIQINDQEKEFVSKISSELLRLTGTQQYLTHSNLSEVISLVEFQNRTIKDSFVNSLENYFNWVEYIPILLLAHRTTKHSSTNMTPYEIIYNRSAVLPFKPSNKSE